MVHDFACLSTLPLISAFVRLNLKMVCAFFGADLGKITNVPGVLNALTTFSMAETDLIGCFEIGLMQVIQPHLIFL